VFGDGWLLSPVFRLVGAAWREICGAKIARWVNATDKRPLSCSTRSSPAADVEVFTTPVRAPWASAYAERWVGMVRRELLGRMLTFGRRHGWSVLVEYADHDNTHRPHCSLGQAPPLGPAQPPVTLAGGRVVRRERLGGLMSGYSWVA
jgi:transposase InsO family protein